MSGQYEAAARELESLVEDKPEEARARYALVHTLIELGRLDEAAAVASAGSRTGAKSGYVWAALGDVQMVLGDFEEARASYSQGVDRKIPRARIGLARLLASEGEMKAARLQVESAHQDDSSDRAILLWMASVAVGREAMLGFQRKALERPLLRADRARQRALEGFISAREQLGSRGTCELADAPRPVEFKLRKIRNSIKDQTFLGTKVSLNGAKPFVVVLDTGASGFFVTRRLADRAGATTLAQIPYRGIGPEDTRPADLAHVNRIELGGLALEDCLVYVVDNEHLDGLMSGHDALMGLNTLYNDFLVTLDFSGAALRLQPLPPLPVDEEGRRDFYGYDRDTRRLGEGFQPIRVFGSHLLVPTLVNNDIRSYFLLDSGASTNILAERLAGELRTLWTSGVRVRGLSGEIREVKAVRNVSLTVGEIRQPHESILALPLDGLAARSRYGLDGIVGYALLRHSVVTIDARNSLIRVAVGRVQHF